MPETNRDQVEKWDFETGSSRRGSDESDARGSLFSSALALLNSARDHPRTVTFTLLTLMSLFATIALRPRAPEPSYDVPGGAVQPLNARKMNRWLDITDLIRERIGNDACPPIRSRTLFAYFGELGERTELRESVRRFLKEKKISLEQYRKMTHDIALTYPFRELSDRRILQEQPETTDDQRPDSTGERIRANRTVVRNHLKRLEDNWFALLDLSDRKQQVSTGQRQPQSAE